MRDEYGSPEVLRFEDIDKPVPDDDEVLVEVRASSINTADLDHLRGRPRVARVGMGLGKPRTRILGFDMAGTVEAVGRSVTRFASGDGVWADLFSSGGGAFAEYVCVSETALHPKPPALSFEDAATLPHSSVLALQGLRGMGGVQKGDRVLVNGAGGCVGPFAVQIAKALGATEVTGVDHGSKLDMLRSLGVDHVIDYTREDFTRSGRRYDFILDIASNHWVFANRHSLETGSRYVQIARNVSGFLQAALGGGLISMGGSRRMGAFGWAPNKRNDMEFLAGLVEAGKLTPLIDRRFPLNAVPDALRHHEEGRSRGKLLISP